MREKNTKEEVDMQRDLGDAPKVTQILRSVLASKLSSKMIFSQLAILTREYSAPLSMASNVTTKSFAIITRPIRRRTSTAGFLPLSDPLLRARYLTTTTPQYRDTTYPTDGPRWHQSPPLMRAPFKHRLTHQPYVVNSDPAELDAFYVRFLGPGGDKILTDEVKWLAVTHKSFDHGSRGFCDRLAFLGMTALGTCRI